MLKNTVLLGSRWEIQSEISVREFLQRELQSIFKFVVKTLSYQIRKQINADREYLPFSFKKAHVQQSFAP
jgi:hypothetical protein